MTNAELIKALQCASHFALYQDCYEKNCYANSGKGLYCNIPKLIADAAAALETAEKRIAGLEAQLPKEGEWIFSRGDGKTCVDGWTCSACGNSFHTNVPYFEEFHYCPNCGCRMDGETEYVSTYSLGKISVQNGAIKQIIEDGKEKTDADS